jgi:hypothetical protein
MGPGNRHTLQERVRQCNALGRSFILRQRRVKGKDGVLQLNGDEGPALCLVNCEHGLEMESAQDIEKGDWVASMSGRFVFSEEALFPGGEMYRPTSKERWISLDPAHLGENAELANFANTGSTPAENNARLRYGGKQQDFMVGEHLHGVVNLRATKRILRGTRIRAPYGRPYTAFLRAGGAGGGSNDGSESEGNDSDQGGKVKDARVRCTQCGRVFGSKGKMAWHYTQLAGRGVNKCIRPPP